MNKEKLDKILANHKLWLSSGGKKGKRANFRSVDLRYVNLSFADLSYANLSYANLRSVNLSYANLRYVDLSYADLRYANLNYADLSYANLRYTDLRYVDLNYADLNSADLDYSAFPLGYGGLKVNIDDKQATQLLYHLVSNVQFSKNTSEEMKKICKIEEIVKKANEFHRVKEFGFIEEDTIESEAKT